MNLFLIFTIFIGIQDYDVSADKKGVWVYLPCFLRCFNNRQEKFNCRNLCKNPNKNDNCFKKCDSKPLSCYQNCNYYY